MSMTEASSEWRLCLTLKQYKKAISALDRATDCLLPSSMFTYVHSFITCAPAVQSGYCFTSFCLCVCLSVCVSVCLCVCVSVCLSDCVSVSIRTEEHVIKTWRRPDLLGNCVMVNFTCVWISATRDLDHWPLDLFFFVFRTRKLPIISKKYWSKLDAINVIRNASWFIAKVEQKRSFDLRNKECWQCAGFMLLVTV